MPIAKEGDAVDVNKVLFYKKESAHFLSRFATCVMDYYFKILALWMKTNYLFAQPTQARHHLQLMMLRHARV